MAEHWRFPTETERGNLEMTGPELDRAIDFLLQQHARFMEEIEQLKEVQKQQSKDIGQLKDTQERQGENIAPWRTKSARPISNNLRISRPWLLKCAEPLTT
jgi:hypothetical protein